MSPGLWPRGLSSFLRASSYILKGCAFTQNVQNSNLFAPVLLHHAQRVAQSKSQWQTSRHSTTSTASQKPVIAHLTISRDMTSKGAPLSTAIAQSRTQAHDFLRLALNSDDSLVQNKYLHAAKEVLIEIEIATELAKSTNLKELSPHATESDFENKDRDQFKIKAEKGCEDDEEEEEENGSLYESDIDSDEEQQWSDDEEEGDDSSKEEEWDVNNGANTSISTPRGNPLLIHYFTNGPGKIHLDMTTVRCAAHNTCMDLPVEQSYAVKNLDVRVYAHMLELFEIESRHRLNLCYAEHNSREEV